MHDCVMLLGHGNAVLADLTSKCGVRSHATWQSDMAGEQLSSSAVQLSSTD